MRNHNLDLLRILAMLAVIVIHAAAPFLFGSGGHNSQFIIALLYDSFSRFCVPLFIMISGALVFSYGIDLDTNPWQFYKRKLVRFAPPLLLWFILYWIFNGRFESVLNSTNISEAFRNMWQIVTSGVPHYHLWYVFMLPGLFLISPLLVFIKRKVTPKQWVYIGIGLLLFGILHNGWRSITGASFPHVFEFIDFLGYFILGDVLLNRKYSKLLSFIGFIGGSLLLAIAIYLFTLRYPGNFAFDAFLSPFIVITTISLYVLINQNLEVAKSGVVHDIALSSFGIYLVHAMVIDSLMKVTNLKLTSFVAVDIFLYTILTLAISYAIVKVLRGSKITMWSV